MPSDEPPPANYAGGRGECALTSNEKRSAKRRKRASFSLALPLSSLVLHLCPSSPLSLAAEARLLLSGELSPVSKILKYSFAFIVAAVAIAQTLRAEGDPITKLHAFSEKVAAQRKASSPNQQSRESSLLGQLQSLEGCIQRNEFEKAQMTIANLSSDLMPGNLQAGWLDLSAGLSEEISRRSAEARQKTQTAVDELVQDVHAACL